MGDGLASGQSALDGSGERGRARARERKRVGGEAQSPGGRRLQERRPWAALRARKTLTSPAPDPPIAPGVVLRFDERLLVEAQRWSFKFL